MERDQGIDLGKSIAIFAVVLIHCHPFGLYEGEPRNAIEIFAMQCLRFAVPFFFIISGYYLGKSQAKGGNPYAIATLRAKKFMILYFIWSLLYLGIQLNLVELSRYGYGRLVYWQIIDYIQNPSTIFLLGSATHLWFLPALAIGTLIATFLRTLTLAQSVLFLVIVYPLGVLMGPYHELSIPLNFWIGPYMGGVFVFIGLQLAKININRIPTFVGPLLLVMGFIGQQAESSLINALCPKDLTTIDFAFSTLFFGLGFALTMFTIKKTHECWHKLGSLTLGIYLCHVWVLQALSILRIYDIAWVNSFLVPVIVFIAAYGMTIMVKRSSALRPMIA